MGKEKHETTRFEAFLRMDAVISTLIPCDPPDFKMRSLSNNELLGYASALDAYLEATQREWIRRQMVEENA